MGEGLRGEEVVEDMVQRRFDDIDSEDGLKAVMDTAVLACQRVEAWQPAPAGAATVRPGARAA